MQTQRDHVHAHQFQMSRMSSALVLGDPSVAVDPVQRTVVGLFVGVLLGVLVLAGFTAYGWLVPGGKASWRSADAIIVEKETGNRYVYLGGSLRPTLNLTSAMLIAGEHAKVELTSSNSLKGVPHGSPVGLPAAPQSLPGPGSLATGPWLACAPGAVTGGGGIGLNLDPAAPATPLAADRFLLVSAGDDHTYLLWRDLKFAIGDDTVAVALGLTNADPIRVPGPWLDLVPRGAELSVPDIPKAGRPGPAVAGRAYRIGQLFTQPGTNGDQLFVLRSDGLAAVDRTAFLLLQAGSRAPVKLDAADVVGAPRSGDRSLTGLLPALADATWEDPAGRVVCARQAPAGAETVAATIVLAAPADAGLRRNGKPRVEVRPGAGMLVYPVPLASGSRTPELTLITDEGIRYRIADGDTLSALKFSSAAAVPFPRALLPTITSGPVLSRTAIDVTDEGPTS